MSNAHFDSLIHAPNRLQICALLSSTDSVEFKVIREQLDISDSALSKHLKVLEDANYIQLDKRLHYGRQRTWISFTQIGQKAFTEHVKALKEIIN